MEDLRQKVINYLVGQHGTISYPKNDGRVEVPQLLIKQLGWDKNRTAYIKFFNGELLIYSKDINDESKNVWIARITDGRIRIPAGVLKNASLNSKELCLTIVGESIVVRSKIRSEKVQTFIDSLNDKQIQYLYSIFVPEFEIQEVDVPESYIIDAAAQKAIDDVKHQEDQVFLNEMKSIGNVELGQPELIMLDITEPTVFRIVGGPFTFPAVWLDKNKEVVRATKGSNDDYIRQLYVIPGIHIKRKVFRHGFLLVQEETFEEIRSKILSYKKDFPEIILFYDTFIPGGFKVYINPPTDIRSEYISEVQSLCKEPMKFVKSKFRLEEWDDEVPEKFPVLVSQNVKVSH